MKKEYSEEEKAAILSELGIVPAKGMISGGQVAKVLTKRAKIETGEDHTYDGAAVRRRVRSESLPHTFVNERINLFHVDDVFALELHPEKWHSRRGKTKKRAKTHSNNP